MVSQVMVLFVGGCTCAEVASLRELTGRDPTLECLIGTTGMITGKSLLMSTVSASAKSI